MHSVENESLDEEALMQQLKQAKKHRRERKKVTEIFGEQTVSQTQTDSKSSGSESGSAQSAKVHPNKPDIERPKPLAASTPSPLNRIFSKFFQSLPS
jgi:hypothetical protein